MSMTTCNICGGEYNANRLDEHCCSCVALERQVAALTNRAKNAENETSIYKEENETLREQLAGAQAVNAKLREALSRLVELKRYKDTNGKDAYYEQEQPKAWAQAGLTLLAPWAADLLTPNVKVTGAARQQE